MATGKPVTDKATIDALRAIADGNGGLLKAADVLEAARDPASPLHSRFTWEDTEAAERWRLHEAQTLVRYVFEYLPGDKSETPQRVFVSLKSDRADGKGYRKTVDVLNSEEMRAQLLADALADMESFRERYRRLKELAEVFQVMKQVEAKVSKRRREKVPA